MKMFIVFFFLCAAVWSCNNEKKEDVPPVKVEIKTDSTLLTDSSWGWIHRDDDINDLHRLFRAGDIRDERICGAECVDSVDVTKIYPEKENEMIIYWDEGAYHKRIAFIENYREGSPYHTATGLKIGSTLRELLKINGQKITFSGFGWDYGGGVQSYHNGSLEKSNIHFELDLVDADGDELMGDTEFDTDMLAVKNKLDKIRVARISLTWFNKE